MLIFLVALILPRFFMSRSEDVPVIIHIVTVAVVMLLRKIRLVLVFFLYQEDLIGNMTLFLGIHPHGKLIYQYFLNIDESTLIFILVLEKVPNPMLLFCFAKSPFLELLPLKVTLL